MGGEDLPREGFRDRKAQLQEPYCVRHKEGRAAISDCSSPRQGPRYVRRALFGPLGQYLDQWLQTAAKPKLKAKTFRDYENILTRYVRPALAQRPLAKVTPLDLQALYKEILERGLLPEPSDTRMRLCDLPCSRL